MNKKQMNKKQLIESYIRKIVRKEARKIIREGMSWDVTYFRDGRHYIVGNEKNFNSAVKKAIALSKDSKYDDTSFIGVRGGSGDESTFASIKVDDSYIKLWKPAHFGMKSDYTNWMKTLKKNLKTGSPVMGDYND